MVWIKLHKWKDYKELKKKTNAMVSKFKKFLRIILYIGQVNKYGKSSDLKILLFSVQHFKNKY